MTTHYSLPTVLKSALLAGLVAGLVVAGFHFVATEPIIEQAIALEVAHGHEPGGADAEPIVSRDIQRVGLIVGFLMYGLTWAVLFGGVFSLAQSSLPIRGAWAQSLLLGGLGFWALALLPFLKYPANPPAVGAPETIAYRQALYVGTLALGILGAILVVWLTRRWGWRIGAPVLLVISAAILIVMPGNPDAVSIPAELLDAFRVRSLLGLTLFWALLSLIFGFQLDQRRKASPTQIPHGNGQGATAWEGRGA